MPKIPFLDHKTDIYLSHEAAWKRDERRLVGGDAVLAELLRWKGEDQDYYDHRLASALAPDLPKRHATRLVGHLSKQTPPPDYAELGTVRGRSKIDTPSQAELLHFNADGIGQDGTELKPWLDGVNERALATGYRWVMVEAPTLETLREIRARAGRRSDSPISTLQDVLDGFRPFGIERSPLDVPYPHFTNGQLDFAVQRVAMETDSLLDSSGGVKGESDKGYYLVVRRGYRGLGSTYSEGGWWKYSPDHDLLPDGHGLWDKTGGQIPLFQFFGERNPGTYERPAAARSLTMELGQISSGLMNLLSARDWNAFYSAKSINYFLGIWPKEHGLVIDQSESGSINVGVPPIVGPDGSTVLVPSVWNSSAAAIDSGVFTTIIESQLAIAREIMVRQVSPAPDASGARVEAGHAEETSPLLARLAATRQGAMNTFLYFYSLRSGFPNPRAVVEIPRDFDLQPVVDDIDAMLNTLKRSWLRSPTWEAELVLRSGDERGLLPEDTTVREKIKAELAESGTRTDVAVEDLMNA